jgi:hypothetical protein
MTLSAQQLVDCRRWMGYSLSGNTTASGFRELVYSDVSYLGLSLDYRLANLSAEEENTLTTYFLANLAKREQEIQEAACNLDTDQAAVWKHNRNEISDRRDLFTALRRELCTFLGFEPGPQLGSSNRLVRA